MSELRSNLFDTDFEQLVALGRALLPKYAPMWTDHNLHDPGIMLIELLSWTAETQIYSLARLRTDERWAFGALLGIKPRGPLPADGLVWPPDNYVISKSLVLNSGAEITAEQSQAQPFRLSYPINLTMAKLVDVKSLLKTGRELNHKEANDRPDASYYPYGEQADSGDRFVLNFEGTLLAADNPDSRNAFLSLGVRVPPDNFSPSSASEAFTSTATGHSPLASQLVASLLDGQFRYPLKVEVDSTDGFLGTGCILLNLAEVPITLGNKFSIEFKSEGTGLVGPPRILFIQPNVLPIVQQKTITLDLGDWSAGDLPDQQFKLEGTGILYSSRSDYAENISVDKIDKEMDSALCGPKVKFGDNNWKCTEELSENGPDDTVFSYDPNSQYVRFGNGINGKIPPHNSPLQIEYEVTAGAAGNLPAGLKWTVQGINGFFGSNLDPTKGGIAALDLSELRRLARGSIRHSETIVTSKDLEQAAYALPDLRVARAEALPIPDLGSHCSALVDVRTLVTLRTRSFDAHTTENPRWLAEVQRKLTPRVPLGERLRVIAPDYVSLIIHATLFARSGYDLNAIKEQALQVLTKLFTLVPTTSSTEVWPLGKAVEKLDIRARLLSLEGVASVKDCILLWDGQPATEKQPSFSSRFLPLWQSSQSQIKVERQSMGAVS